MTRTWPAAVAVLAAAFLACSGGGGRDGERPAPKATVRGTLAQSTAFAVDGQVSFALQWMGALYPEQVVNSASISPDPQFEITCEDVVPIVEPGCDGTAMSGEQRCRTVDVLATALLQPVRYAPQFPIAFEIPVEGPPPAMALYDLSKQGGSGVYAMGTLIAFVDENGDGALRLGTPGVAGERGLANSAYQDYLPPDATPRLAWFVTYLDGHVDPAGVHPSFAEVVLNLPQGYALWQKEEWVDAYGRRISVHRSAQPIDATPVALVSRPGIEEAAGWCSAYDVDTTWVPEIPAGEVPLSCWGDPPDGGEWSRSTAVAPCTYVDERYLAYFQCTSASPPWASQCPGR